ncbi:MAG: 4-alpha-glucanotransferase [Candidatus Omnitrophica bacterium]|nr:4-alpha-glucanotransferase [Candidatus Omnitrophota bacterium]
MSVSRSEVAWQRIGRHKRSGVVAPLFSLYSEKSVGIGDLFDLKQLIDWAAATGNSIIQLLPMNEVGACFCPYDSLSSFALEPIYCNLDSLSCAQDKSIQHKLRQLKTDFPVGSAYINYAFKKEKMNLLVDMYDIEKRLHDPAFERFQKEMFYWLHDFALFKALKQYHRNLPWYEWMMDFKNRNRKALHEFGLEYEEEIKFEMWLQWILYKQLKEVKQYAASRKVLLKGDLPILVSRDSADVWQHPEFFKLDFAAGAPPDMYCAKGQRWGMPPHNWEIIEADDFMYLKEKLRFAQNFYDIVRIDHVVGLFRIWSIPYADPQEDQGLHGFFDPRDEGVWEGQGRKILSVILEATDMLVCAEDLGIIPYACTKALQDFSIPGNEVQRWVKDWNHRHDFLAPADYRECAVAMLSTHDTTNWCAWWEYEAGTVDEELFKRKCHERGIDFVYVKNRLFDPGRCRNGRLRWMSTITSVDLLVEVLGRTRDEVLDFINLYCNTYREKEKFWQQVGLPGPMQEQWSKELLEAALRLTLQSRSLFVIQTLVDWLYLAGIFQGDSYRWRINTPGTIQKTNWSQVIPICLDDLQKHPVTTEIKALIQASNRAL